MTVKNRTKTLRQLFIEPECFDYWMKPEEEFELRGEVTSEEGHFDIWYTDGGLQVFPSNDMDCISVFCNGEELEIGHQRPDD